MSKLTLDHPQVVAWYEQHDRQLREGHALLLQAINQLSFPDGTVHVVVRGRATLALDLCRQAHAALTLAEVPWVIDGDDTTTTPEVTDGETNRRPARVRRPRDTR